MSEAATAGLERARCIVNAAEPLLAAAKAGVERRVAATGSLDASQHAAHGLAWFATYIEALRQLTGWAQRLEAERRLGELERLLLSIGTIAYAHQLVGGIAMSPGEIVRPIELGIEPTDLRHFEDVVRHAEAADPAEACRQRLASVIADDASAASHGDACDDPTLAQMRDLIQRFVRAEVAPYAHQWHLANAYVPDHVMVKLGELGVFGVSIPEPWGGLGLGKVAMCVVSEELSRGYIGVGSLGTRSEIAAELILNNGTSAQQHRYLDRIASGEVIPTAVFTEPDTGSDLAALKTRAERVGDSYRVTGQKTWITHPVRADLMTLLVRTRPDQPGYRGLSMLLAEKPRGSDAQPFPVAGLTGGEIEVLGYRGLKEYELAFDGFEVPASQLLGEVEGQGFKQLMTTFEAARIQTAARAVGVAQSAMDLALDYALHRRQFGQPIMAFPRVANKIVMMAVEIMIARQLTYFAAREKDAGRRCDLEAGMAKLLAARVAWAAADNAVQIHGGNGFALEYPVSRILCDARILSIFEGAAEIQAHVIARRLLEHGN